MSRLLTSLRSHMKLLQIKQVAKIVSTLLSFLFCIQAPSPPLQSTPPFLQFVCPLTTMVEKGYLKNFQCFVLPCHVMIASQASFDSQKISILNIETARGLDIRWQSSLISSGYKIIVSKLPCAENSKYSNITLFGTIYQVHIPCVLTRQWILSPAVTCL